MNIAIIGYKNHARRLISNIEILNVCSKLTIFHPNKDKLINNFDSVNLSFKIVFTSLLKDIFLSDCIFIAAPTSMHYEYITKILSSYKGYIFCEKPPCSSLGQANNLSSIKLQEKERIYFNFNYRFSGLAKLCKEAINSNKYGKLIALEFFSSHGIAFKSNYKDNWRNNTNGILENIVGNVGIHYIDLVNYLLNDVKIVSVNALKVSDQSNFPDSCLIIISSKGYLPSTIHLSYAAPFQNKARFTFSDAIIELTNGELSIYTPRESFDENGMFMPAPKKIIKDYQNSREYYDNALYESIKFFIDNVKNGKKLSEDDFNCSIKTSKDILSLKIL